ncbi:Uncharacterised protein [Streptococcus pseudoporcinus]|uniref:Uncharacterized protein n=1 Tax=Streptococcus pseudoporcinus TaxID=361101 RepID=A0A4U9YFQ9_9STRE|nr:Uncharacterised protein [Streptococcus pseudoporcinus]VUC70995.1 Uncharacterised protein [Streptococcus pseudoporcinus]VUD00593.1 Uncharacterised protein [Streptococcus pseudoporcinus]VUD00968.1 Uncharacterised protein [Streptococcus pseudoporcinus]
MESQYRKITYRMKRRGMYWSKWGISTMAKIIILELSDKLQDLFLVAGDRNFLHIEKVALV